MPANLALLSHGIWYCNLTSENSFLLACVRPAGAAHSGIKCGTTSSRAF